MKPFAWYDHFNDEFIRTEGVALRALAGGNKVTPLYTEGQLPDRRFTAAVAALQGAISNPLTGTECTDEPKEVAKSAVAYADALLAELAK